mmetsp:Transcript_24929/g.38375  ORF Transcript_24929/g.38375 Transcript_24929/m.38375 type:complete len:147 (+) Transcript_24929:89-529(+)
MLDTTTNDQRKRLDLSAHATKRTDHRFKHYAKTPSAKDLRPSVRSRQESKRNQYVVPRRHSVHHANPELHRGSGPTSNRRLERRVASPDSDNESSLPRPPGNGRTLRSRRRPSFVSVQSILRFSGKFTNFGNKRREKEPKSVKFQG